MTGTLADLIESRARGRRAAWVDAATGETTTYAGAVREARAAAERWRALGAAPGAAAALRVTSHASGYRDLLGLLRLGAVPMPLDPRVSADEASVLERDAGVSRRVAAAGPDPEAPAVIWATSGTTGLPKGVAVSHRAAFARWDSTAAAFGLGEDTVALSLLPLAFSFMYPCLNTFYQGGTLVLAPAYDLALLASLGDLIERRRVTTFFAVPAVIRHLVDLRARFDPRRFRGLRFVVCASAHLEPALAAGFETAYGVPLLNCYGLKETGFIAASRIDARDPASVGTVCPGVELRVAGGEVSCRGPLLASGYMRAGALDASAFRGWFKTKDLGRLDAGGRLFLEGRVDDIITRDGLKIAPVEVEGALRRHPAVADAAALGLPDRTRGQRVAACVVLARGARATEAELAAHCRGLLPAYKCPARILFARSIPRTSTGKERRAALRRLFA